MPILPPYAKDELCPYRRYPELYAERKFADLEICTYDARPFHLLDLLPELRILIHDDALVLPFPIEFWPKIDCPLFWHHSAVSQRNLQWLREKMRQRGVNLGLLRVCKTVHVEVTKVWYGKNEWRFSGLNGWVFASAFLFTAQAFSFKNIRSLTLPLPFDVQALVQFIGARLPTQNIRSFRHLAERIHFTPAAEWKCVQSIIDACSALQKCDCLRIVNIVVPGWYESSWIDEATRQSMLQQITDLEKAARGRLKVRLIRLSVMGTTIAAPAEVETKQRDLIEECRGRGWGASCDRFGRYAIEE